jgi:hypothetical protein
VNQSAYAQGVKNTSIFDGHTFFELSQSLVLSKLSLTGVSLKVE